MKLVEEHEAVSSELFEGFTYGHSATVLFALVFLALAMVAGLIGYLYCCCRRQTAGYPFSLITKESPKDPRLEEFELLEQPQPHTKHETETRLKD